MARWLETIGLYWRPPDLRSRREVDDEIAAELDFHLAQRASDLEREGLSPDAARLEAQRRFGDRARIEKACRQAQIGERLMLQRLQIGLIVALLASVAIVGWQSWSSQRRSEAQLAALGTRIEDLQKLLASSGPVRSEGAGAPASSRAEANRGGAAVEATRVAVDASNEPSRSDGASTRTSAPLDPDVLLARLNGGADAWRVGAEVGEELAKLPPDEGWKLLQTIWPHVSSSEIRRQLLQPFVGMFASYYKNEIHPRVLDVLDLGARDADVTVQSAALDLLRGYAFEDFSTDFAAYLAWRAKNQGRPVADVMIDGARAFAQKLKSASAAELVAWRNQGGNWRLAEDRPNGPDLVKVLRDEGVLDAAIRWLDEPDQSVREVAVYWLAALHVDFAQVKEWLKRGDQYAWAAGKILDNGRYALAPEQIAELLDSGDYTLRAAALEKFWKIDLNREPELQRRLLDLLAARDELDGATVQQVLYALARPKYKFAVEPLLALFEKARPNDDVFQTAVHALGQIGDPRAIPTLIALRATMTDRQSGALLVANGLGPLTGVDDWTRDVSFWTKWWETNRTRYPPEVRDLPIPKLAWAGQ